MDVTITNGAMELKGHQPTSILCAGVSSLVSAYQLMYPGNVATTKGESHADDLVHVLDNGSESYQMLVNAIRHLDNEIYDIKITEE